MVRILREPEVPAPLVEFAVDPDLYDYFVDHVFRSDYQRFEAAHLSRTGLWERVQLRWWSCQQSMLHVRWRLKARLHDRFPGVRALDTRTEQMFHRRQDSWRVRRSQWLRVWRFDRVRHRFYLHKGRVYTYTVEAPPGDNCPIHLAQLGDDDILRLLQHYAYARESGLSLSLGLGVYALLAALTPAAIWLAYGPVAAAWPLKEMAILLPALTVLAGYAVAGRTNHDTGDPGWRGPALIYGVMVCPMLCMIAFYPGLHALGLGSDDHGIVVVYVGWVHGVALGVLCRYLRRPAAGFRPRPGPAA